MDHSDPYDDGFFDDPEAFEAIVAAEAEAVTASQVPKPPRYHHTVSASSAAPFGRNKDGTPKAPAPLNVQPGSIAGGFGWEAGGKRVAEGNIARHLKAVDDRQAYWKGGKEDEDAPMDFTVDDTGRYGAPEEEVVDNRHLPITITASQLPPRLPPDSKSAQARKQAIVAAMSADHNKRPFARSASISHLAPRQSTPQPSSQGAMVRKLHLDLEDKEKRVEELERQLNTARKEPSERPLWRDEMEVDVDQDEEERKRMFNALQMKVYEAEGRAATLERNKQKDISRYASEAEKLKANVEALQLQMQAKDREYKQQLESLKSQAVFNNHAAMNSVARRQPSQAHSPKVLPDAKKPQPGFKNLVNAFGPSRVKRQRTESPVKLEPRTPDASPKPKLDVEVCIVEPDRKAELLHHIFNYTYISSHRQAEIQPTIFYILNTRSDNLIDPAGDYPLACANILKAFGELESDFDRTIAVLATSFIYMLGVFEQTLAAHVKQPMVMCDVFRMISRTAIKFPSLVESMVNTESNLGKLLHDLARHICEAKERSELSTLLIDVCQATCMSGDGRLIWHSTELVDLVTLFAAQARGVDLFFAASCSTSHFHALTAGKPEGGQPLLDTMARLLVMPHSKASAEGYQNSMAIVRAFSMLTVSDPNGVILISERTVLVPCLVKVLHRESSQIWGINYDSESLKDPLSLLYLALLLLHRLVFPSPYAKAQDEVDLLSPDKDPEPTDDPPQGLNIGDRLIAATQTKEFNGVHHVFQAALGVMAFAEVDLEDIQGQPDWLVTADDLRRIQYLSQDLLEIVAEGPEVDAIYEIYAEEEEEDEGVDPDVYAEMDDVQLVH